MIPFDLALTDSGDLAFNRAMVNDAISLARAYEQEIAWFLGTWLLDKTRGLDWWRLLEEKATDELLEITRERVRSIGQRLRGVLEVTSVYVDFDNVTRLLEIGVEFVAEDGDQTDVTLATSGYAVTNWQPTSLLVEMNIRPSFAS